MTRWYRRPRLWLVLILAVVIVTAVALWLRGAQPDSDHSPLPIPLAESPLSTPIPENATTPPPSAWTNGGAILLWVALGLLLALGIAIVILRLYRQTS